MLYNFFLVVKGFGNQGVRGIVQIIFIFFLVMVWWFRKKVAILHSQTAKEGSGRK